MRLKKEDRNGTLAHTVVRWYQGERVVADEWRNLRLGRRGVAQAMEPTQNPDGSHYTFEQKKAWWHKTMTDHMVARIVEWGNLLKPGPHGPHPRSDATNNLASIKALIFFRRRYPEATEIGSTTRWPSNNHIRAYTDAQDIPYSIKYSARMQPMDLDRIQGAISSLKDIEDKAAHRSAVAERERLISTYRNNKADITRRLKKNEDAVEAWDQEQYETDLKDAEDWLAAMPKSLSGELKINSVVLNPIRQTFSNMQHQTEQIRMLTNRLPITVKWLAENPPLDGGEEE
jgi:hypothetical protein